MALILGLIHGVSRYELYQWEEQNARQYCSPAVTEGARRFGTELVTEPPGSLQRFDLVRFAVPRAGSSTSRVVGLPGERVELSEGRLIVDGAEVENVYAYHRGSHGERLPEILVPRECVLILNDERGKSGSSRMDSRELGPIPIWAVTYRFASKPPQGRR